VAGSRAMIERLRRRTGMDGTVCPNWFTYEGQYEA
jgi:hypothetical protein